MSLFIFLTVVQALVAAGLVVTILMQRSEGGGLGIGGSPNGMMSARGAADFLSRSTKWLAVAFVVLSIVLAAVAVKTTGSADISSTVDRSLPGSSDPLGGASGDQTGSDASEAATAPEAPVSDPLSDGPN